METALNPLTPSDKLAIALACLATLTAIVLYWINKTPITMSVSVGAMVALAVYPVIHFIHSNLHRVSIILVSMAMIGLFGWSNWPHTQEQHQVAATAPIVVPQAKSLDHELPETKSDRSKPRQPHKSQTQKPSAPLPERKEPPVPSDNAPPSDPYVHPRELKLSPPQSPIPSEYEALIKATPPCPGGGQTFYMFDFLMINIGKGGTGLSVPNGSCVLAKDGLCQQIKGTCILVRDKETDQQPSR